MRITFVTIWITAITANIASDASEYVTRSFVFLMFNIPKMNMKIWYEQ